MSTRLIKLSTSLHKKKYRLKYGLFVAEGRKLVSDLLETMEAVHLLCSKSWSEEHPELNTNVIDTKLLQKASSLKTTTEVIGLFKIPTPQTFSFDDLPILILDTIQDPGNLGTIIRTAAWFGFQHIICSPETVDVYNPKVIQSTMGAFSMISLHYQPLLPLLKQIREKNIPIYGAFMQGENIFQAKLENKVAVIIGNEGQGISPQFEQLIDKKISIPHNSAKHPESLNASVSAGIICAELLRAIQN